MPNTTPIGADALREALWICVEHNALHFGETHNTVVQGRAALSAAAHPPAGIWVPTELAKRVQETMGEFLMDHGWRQQDMDTSDEFGALLAVATKAEPLQQPEKVPLTKTQLKQIHHIEEFGLFCDYSEFEQIARAIEQFHGIKPAKEQA